MQKLTAVILLGFLIGDNPSCAIDQCPEIEESLVDIVGEGKASCVGWATLFSSYRQCPRYDVQHTEFSLDTAAWRISLSFYLTEMDSLQLHLERPTAGGTLIIEFWSYADTVSSWQSLFEKTYFHDDMIYK